MAAEAAMRSGLGLLTTYAPGHCRVPLQTAIPEVMFEADPHELFLTEIPSLEKYSAIGLGPGIGTHTQTKNFLSRLLEQNKLPLLLDADAINILAELDECHKYLKNTVLTPHPGEFQRLCGECSSTLLQYEKAKDFCKELSCTIVLKGAYTLITLPSGKQIFNMSGNPGMGTAGSGDVLSGIITGLLAKGLKSEEAALCGVYLHALAGDQAVEKIGEEGMMASDIIGEIPDAIRSIQESEF